MRAECYRTRRREEQNAKRSEALVNSEAASLTKAGRSYAIISDSLNVISKTLRLFWIGVNG
jgi:hypothetical protein